METEEEKKNYMKKVDNKINLINNEVEKCIKNLNKIYDTYNLNSDVKDSSIKIGGQDIMKDNILKNAEEMVKNIKIQLFRIESCDYKLRHL